MTKQEFEKKIGAEISQKDYSIVEHVYSCVSNCPVKNQQRDINRLEV